MSIAGIILLILLGIFLFLVEFLLVPGVTIAGIGGVLLWGGAIYLAYKTHGTTVGNYVLLGTVITIIVTLYFMFKARTWRRLMLDSNIDSKVDAELVEQGIKPGDEGETLTRLNPIGRVLINDITIEGKSVGGFINENTPIIVTKVQNNQVIVKPKNKENE